MKVLWKRQGLFLWSSKWLSSIVLRLLAEKDFAKEFYIVNQAPLSYLLWCASARSSFSRYRWLINMRVPWWHGWRLAYKDDWIASSSVSPTNGLMGVWFSIKLQAMSSNYSVGWYIVDTKSAFTTAWICDDTGFHNRINSRTGYRSKRLKNRNFNIYRDDDVGSIYEFPLGVQTNLRIATLSSILKFIRLTTQT